MKLFSAAPFKKREWAIGLALSTVAAALILVWDASSEIDSKPPTKSPEDYLWDQNTNAFKKMGTNGIRFLTDALASKILLEQHLTLFNKLPRRAQQALAQHYWERPFGRRIRAADVLCHLGPEAAPAVPAVLKVLQDPALGSVKNSCIAILGAIGPQAKPAVPVLLAFATNTDYDAQAAAVALWKISRQTNVLVEAISNRLRFSGQARASILPYFDQLGNDLKPAAAVIEHALYDQHEQVRCQAEGILARIDPVRLHNNIEAVNQNANALLAGHIKALQSGRQEERLCALNAIRVFGPAASNAVPTLVSTLEHCESQVNSVERDTCVAAVGEIGPAGSLAMPMLARLLPQKPQSAAYYYESENAELVYRTLGRIGPGAAEAIPFLKRLLTNSLVPMPGYFPTGQHHLEIYNNIGAATIATALAQITPNDPVVTAALQTLRTNNSDTVSMTALVALWHIGLETNLPLDKLTSAVKMPKNYARHDPSTEAINLLGDIGPAARGALAELEKHLDPADPMRREAAIAIRKIDPEVARRLGLPGLLIVHPQ